MNEIDLIKLILEKKGGNEVKSTEVPFEVGEKYFIRTVTYHCIGLLKDIKGNFLVFEQGAWVADSGRFNNALKTGELNEVEPFTNKFFVNMNAIADSTIWDHDIPTAVI